MSPRQIFALVAAGVFCIIAIILLSMTFVNLDASQIMVIQSPLSGNLTWYTTPGVKWQCFGKVTKYNRRVQFWFSARPDQGKKEDESLPIQFNDGGHARLSGGISWTMPLDEEHLTKIHMQYHNPEALEKDLVRPAIQKAIYFTGPLMSSTESYASRKSDLLKFLEDQVQYGVYQTKTITEIQKDPITGIDKKVSVSQLVLDKNGNPLRIEESPLQAYGISTSGLSLNNVGYEPKVEEQIKQQQDATMRIQLAIAEARKAEQQVLTTQKEGEASAAKAEWEQKTIAAKQTTEAMMKKQVAETEADMRRKVAETNAQQLLEVARLDAEAAEQYKKAEISRGEGESQRRKMAIDADGALEKKLGAWLEAQKAYARAIGEAGPLVPSVIVGSAAGVNGQAGGGAQQLIDLLTVKTAKELGLDMQMNKQAPKKDK